jgi:hypothetical protein
VLRIIRGYAKKGYRNKKQGVTEMNAKEQLSMVLDIQRNEMWTLIEALPNRTYDCQYTQDKDLEKLVKRIQAYLATKDAVQKA